MLSAEMQPSNVVLEGVVTGEAGKLDGEDDVDLAGADVRLEAGSLLEIFGFAPGR